MRDSIKPVIRLGRTNVLLENQGITYNETGLTYNEAGIFYGGIYNHDIVPMVNSISVKKTINSANSFKPKMSVGRTERLLADQGFTYNEATNTYNEAGMEYGGIYKYDVVPIVSFARQVHPTITFGMDFGASVIPAPTGSRGKLIGMLGLTYAR